MAFRKSFVSNIKQKYVYNPTNIYKGGVLLYHFILIFFWKLWLIIIEIVMHISLTKIVKILNLDIKLIIIEIVMHMCISSYKIVQIINLDVKFRLYF